MPSWPVHLKIANELNKKYNFSDDFILGNVIPDTLNGNVIKDISKRYDHTITHYSDRIKYRAPKINIERFLKENKDKLDNELLLGVYIHILTDDYFNEYTIKYHTKLLSEQLVTILNNGKIDSINHPMKVKQDDFKKLGNSFIKDKEVGSKIALTDKTLELTKDLNYPVTTKDIRLTIDKINSIVDEEVEVDENYEMFTKEELFNLYNNCYEYIKTKIGELEREHNNESSIRRLRKKL